MLVPKIVYNPGTGAVTLDFSFPPINKPGPHDGTSDTLKAQRADSFTLSGKKQTAYWRTDTFRTLQMEYVPQEDLPAWNDFFQYAVKGGPFDYYPDATLADFTSWTLEDTDWEPSRNIFRIAKFKLTLRLVV